MCSDDVVADNDMNMKLMRLVYDNIMSEIHRVKKLPQSKKDK